MELCGIRPSKALEDKAGRALREDLEAIFNIWGNKKFLHAQTRIITLPIFIKCFFFC
jgi:hypothetical protein